MFGQQQQQQQGYPQPGYPQQGYPQPGYAQPPPQGPPQAGWYAPPPQPGYAPPPGGYPQNYPNNPNNASHATADQFNYTDPESQTNQFSGFDDQLVRKAFIRKVYSILMVQLAVTAGVISLFMFHEPTKDFTYRHPELFWISFAVMLVTLISMACCTNVRRKAPMNFIFLFLFTLAESFLLGVVSAVYSRNEVLLAIGLTAGVCLALTIFAFQTKWDFTMLGGALCAASFVLLIFGIFAIFFRGQTMTLLYASIGVIIFSLYLVYDTQLMMGGKHKYSISPEEYIFAALNLYLDIVQIFLYILTIIGASRN